VDLALYNGSMNIDKFAVRALAPALPFNPNDPPGPNRNRNQITEGFSSRMMAVATIKAGMTYYNKENHNETMSGNNGIIELVVTS
jgi:hypothetical protein